MWLIGDGVCRVDETLYSSQHAFISDICVTLMHQCEVLVSYGQLKVCTIRIGL